MRSALYRSYGRGTEELRISRPGQGVGRMLHIVCYTPHLFSVSCGRDVIYLSGVGRGLGRSVGPPLAVLLAGSTVLPNNALCCLRGKYCIRVHIRSNHESA